MIRALVWKDSVLLAVPDAWKTLELLRQRRVFSFAFFNCREEIPAEIRSMAQSWYVALCLWPRRRAESIYSLKEFLKCAFHERNFTPDNDVAYVGDENNDVLLAGGDGLIPVLVRTGSFGFKRTPWRQCVVLPSAHFVPGWVARENKKALAPDFLGGGPRAIL